MTAKDSDAFSAIKVFGILTMLDVPWVQRSMFSKQYGHELQVYHMHFNKCYATSKPQVGKYKCLFDIMLLITLYNESCFSISKILFFSWSKTPARK